MGVDYDVILCYGIEFSYDEIKHFKHNDKNQELAEYIDIDFLPDLWSELGFISTSPYYCSDEKDHNYIIGKEMKNDLSLNEFIKDINPDKINLYIKNICEQYNLQYKEPKILCRVNIW